MKKTTHQPHNNLFEMLMSISTEAEEFVEAFADELRGKIKRRSYQLKNRTHVGDDLQPHIPDVIYEVEYEDFPAYLYLLFEHKSQYELVDVQLGRYIWVGYHEQKRAWSQENKAIKERNKIRKEEGKPKEEYEVSLGKFVPRLILPIVVYHGESEWKDEKLADFFQIPEDLKKYIPSIEYILIDLSDYPDEFIEQLKSKLLAGILLLLKHKGDKEFVLQYSQKIFNFVEDAPQSDDTKSLLKTVLNYIYQTFHLKTKEVQDIITKLPYKAKEDMTSIWDKLIQEGQVKGEAIGEARGEARGEAKGEAKGEQIGKQETELKKNLELTLNLIKEMPKLKNKKVAKITKVEKSFVKKIRKTFAKKQEEKIVAFLQEMFKDLPQMDNKRWLALEKWGLDLWKEYQAS